MEFNFLLHILNDINEEIKQIIIKSKGFKWRVQS